MTRGRILRLAFVTIACLSLLINAVVLGIGLRLADRGMLWKDAAQALHALPSETREALVASLVTQRPQLRALRETLQEERRAMLALVVDKPVDPMAVEAAMARVRAATTALQLAAHDTILNSLQTSQQD